MTSDELEGSTTARMARVGQLLAAAQATRAKVTDCWAATPSENGGVNVRIVVPIAEVAGEEDWTVSFVTRRSSRKVADIQRAGHLTLGYQHHPDRAYVTLTGRAALVEDRAEVRRRWIERWRLYFPNGPDDPDTVLIKMTADCIELCVPGVTPEPFGSRHSVIGRNAQRGWALVSD